MLKRKLLKAGLITSSFVFMAASSGSKTFAMNDSDSLHAAYRKGHDAMGLVSHSFDSAGLCICVPSIETGEPGDAPRIQLNRNGVKFINDHIRRNTESFEKIRTTKGHRYFPIIDTVFMKHGLPVQLKYLAVIESKLNTHALSKVGARGMWQFMPATAKRFGLRIRGKYDERTLAYKSTVAAAQYLNYLYGLFDDWLLTIAAYNSGPGYVYAAIKKSGSRNFWVLQRFLPLETRNHVKKFIGTHYYYEGNGGVTTLTKAETEAHIKAVAAYVEKKKELELASAEEPVVAPVIEIVKVSQE